MPYKAYIECVVPISQEYIKNKDFLYFFLKFFKTETKLNNDTQ